MDKQQARLILRSFRPNGADGDDKDFADALKLAIEDRELGEWLAAERAFDAAFAKSLGSVDLPTTLREDILACLAAERSDFPQVENLDDAAWVGALATIQAPPALRESVIAAMEMTAANSRQKSHAFRRLGLPVAAAAGIMLALLINRQPEPTRVTDSGPVAIDALQAGFIRTYESPLFSLDEKRDDHGVLIAHLENRRLPCPKTLPRGLRNVTGIGCRELVIDGKRGSLVCFDERENGIVHLIIFRREDVNGVLPDKEQPQFSKVGSWVSARWADESHVFLVVSHTELDKLSKLF